MAWFYEIRSSDNAVLKRDGGFPTQDAAKIAGREDAKKMKNYASAGQAGCWAHHGGTECGKGYAILIPFAPPCTVCSNHPRYWSRSIL